MPEQDYRAAETQSFGGYLRHAWNVFRNKDPIYQDIGTNKLDRLELYSPGAISYIHPDHRRLNPSIDRTLAAAIYSRIATDASMANIRHVRTDSNNMFVEELHTGLNNILTCEANKDQTGRA